MAASAASLLATAAQARPITYRDGTRIYYEANDLKHGGDLAYSISSRAALAFELAWHSPSPSAANPLTEAQYLFRWDQLWARHNGESFQASFYTNLGIGYLVGGGHPDRSHARFGFSADAETQRFGVFFHASQGGSPRLQPIFESRARIGFAPYVAEFEQLQNWIYLQLDRDSFHGDRRTRLGPVLRFTYKNLLWELGAQSDPSDFQKSRLTLAFEVTL